VEGKGEKMGENEDRGGERDGVDDGWIILDIYETMRGTKGRAMIRIDFSWGEEGVGGGGNTTPQYLQRVFYDISLLTR